MNESVLNRSISRTNEFIFQKSFPFIYSFLVLGDFKVLSKSRKPRFKLLELELEKRKGF